MSWLWLRAAAVAAQPVPPVLTLHPQTSPPAARPLTPPSFTPPSFTPSSLTPPSFTPQLLTRALIIADLPTPPITPALLHAAAAALRALHGERDPLAREGAAQDLLDALGLEAGRCSGELDRVWRALRWLALQGARP